MAVYVDDAFVAADWGYWTGTQHAGFQNLPSGHWVYVYPKWYIWRNKVK